jgi:hypothetical protein
MVGGVVEVKGVAEAAERESTESIDRWGTGASAKDGPRTRTEHPSTQAPPTHKRSASALGLPPLLAPPTAQQTADTPTSPTDNQPNRRH